MSDKGPRFHTTKAGAVHPWVLFSQYVDETGDSHSALATHFRVSPRTVRGWLYGPDLPSAMALTKICSRMGYKGEQLLYSVLWWRHFKKDAISNDVLDLDLNAEFASLAAVVKPEDTVYLGKVWSKYRADPVLWERLNGSSVVTETRILMPAPPRFIITRWTDIVKEVSTLGAIPPDMNWQGFEDLVAEILRRHDWEISPLARTRDGGIDILAVRDLQPGLRTELIVQCKPPTNPANKVGVQVVRELWGVWDTTKATHAMIATSSYFTSPARQQASCWNMNLSDQDRIVEWCRSLSRPPSGRSTQLH